MAKTKRTAKQLEASTANLKNIAHWKTEEVKAELAELDPTNYGQILQWLCCQDYSKVKYISTLSCINLFIKCVASALCNDIEKNSSRCMENLLPYLAQKQATVENVNISNEKPNLTIEVSSELIENNIQKLIQ